MSAVKKIKFANNLLNFTYEIQNFQPDVIIRYLSDDIYFPAGHNQSKWRILVEPKSGGDELFGIYLALLSDLEVKVRCGFKIIDPKNQVVTFFEFAQCFKNDFSWGKRMDRSILAKALSSGNVFRVNCEMKLIDSEFRTSNLIFHKKLEEISSENFFDLKIKVKNQTIMAHRLIVSAASPVLYEKIKGLNRVNTPLELDGFSFETIQKVVNFIYKKKFELNEETVEEILKAANKFEVTNLRVECEKFLFENLSVGNALSTLMTVNPKTNKLLLTKTVEFIEKNIDAISSKKTWQRFSIERPLAFKGLFTRIFTGLSRELSEELQSQSQNSSNTSSQKSGDSSTAIKDLSDLHESMVYADVVFDVDGKTLKAHKAILSCRSKVFAAMFKHDTSESQSNTIEIQDADYDTMKSLLEFIYSEQVSKIEGNAINLYTVADKYDFPELKDLCSDYLKENLTVDNVLDIFTFANFHSSLQSVKSRAFYFILQNFEKPIAKWDEFAQQNPKILEDFLAQALELRKNVAK